MEEVARGKDDFDLNKTPTMEDLINLDDRTEPDAAMRFRRTTTSISISSIRILTEDEIGRVKTKFFEEIETAYAEAIRAHVSTPLSCF